MVDQGKLGHTNEDDHPQLKFKYDMIFMTLNIDQYLSNDIYEYTTINGFYDDNRSAKFTITAPI